PKVVIEQTRGKWLIECSELAGMKKGEVEDLKGMLSRTSDRERLAYDRITSEVPRQFITIGTTNNQKYLKDQTGNRRVWPVLIKKFNLEALKRDVDQIWAEAAAREAKGESIRLDPQLWGAAGLEQEQRTAEDPWWELLEEHFDPYPAMRIPCKDVWKLIQ